MIDVEEHKYDDDPKQGHPDVRTCLAGVSYFFLGNGHIQAAIQVAPEGEGTPVALILMDPEKLIKKREAMTFDPERGFEKTRLRILVEGKAISPTSNQGIRARWKEDSDAPVVEVDHGFESFEVRERFFCTTTSDPRLLRTISVTNTTDASAALTMETGVPGASVNETIRMDPGEKSELTLEYTLNPDRTGVSLKRVPPDAVAEQTPATRTQTSGQRTQATENRAETSENRLHVGANPTRTSPDWAQTTAISFDRKDADHLFKSACFQLPAVVSSTGKVDASLWQYNREWVRDHSFMGIGLTLAGHHATARTLLERLLREFVTEDGDTIDSSERRDPEDVELDQNGILLYALGRYVLHTHDLDIVSDNWAIIEKTAAYPLGDVFRHRFSGMLHNSREYWERHAALGIQDGLELMYQFFMAEGLRAGAYLARKLSKDDAARKWNIQAKELKAAILKHPEFALLDDRGFIKRKGLNGTVQETIGTCSGAGLPDGVPLTQTEIEHFLNPDTSSALPVAHGFVPHDSKVAQATLDSMELLWNQCWDTGGYGRYDYSSEADSAGPWPFASLFIARACMEAKRHDKVQRIFDWLLSIPGAQSGAFFEMYGPRIAPPFAQVGITPWTWAEMVVLFVHHIAGIRPEEEHIRIKPNLLPGMDEVSGRIPLRNKMLHVNYKRKKDGKGIDIETDAKIIESHEGEVIVSL